MKAFIDSCRTRGKGYFPSEGEAEVFSPALDLELQLNGHTANEDSPLPTTTSIRSNMLPTSQSTIPCRHTGCNKKFSTTSNRNKHEAAYHARAVTEATRASKRQKKEPIFYIPHDDLRDFRATTETCKLRAIGKTRKIAEIENQEILRKKMAWSSKMNLAKSGVTTFGTVSYLLFKKKVSEKMGKEIPQHLFSFNINDGVDLAVSSFKAIMSIIFGYVEAAFIAYKAKI